MMTMEKPKSSGDTTDKEVIVAGYKTISKSHTFTNILVPLNGWLIDSVATEKESLNPENIPRITAAELKLIQRQKD